MSATYRAVQVVAPGEFRLVDLPVREPPRGHVRIRVEACGVCHSDALTVEGRVPGLEYPRTPGHEVIGAIEAIACDVERWTVGQRVGVGFLGGHCGVCNPCRRGTFVHCQHQPISGVKTDGGYAEVMIAKATALAAIPEELSSVDAAPLMCAGLTTFNALRKFKARAGDLVAVQGVGGLGHLAIQYARAMGFKVAALARGAQKRDIALKLGAHHYLDSAAQDPAAGLQELGGARAILATAADNKSMSALMGGLAPLGELIVAGVGGEPMTLDTIPFLFSEAAVSGTVTGTAIDGEDTLSFSVLSGTRAMVEVMPLAQAEAAYRRMERGAARFRIVLVP